MNQPIISFEISQMRHTLKTMLSQHTMQMDSDLQAAVDAYCAEGNLKSIINKQVRQCMNEVVTSEIKAFFGYSGKGRAVIREAVLEHLNAVYPDEPKEQT